MSDHRCCRYCIRVPLNGNMRLTLRAPSRADFVGKPLPPYCCNLSPEKCALKNNEPPAPVFRPCWFPPHRQPAQIVLRCYRFSLPLFTSLTQRRPGSLTKTLLPAYRATRLLWPRASGQVQPLAEPMSHKPVQARSNYNSASQRYPQTSPPACSTPDSMDCWGSFTPRLPAEDMYAARLRC